MRNALVFYFATRAPGYTGRKFGYKTIADSYHVPQETFRRRLSGPLKGFFGHIAGGHNSAQNFITVSQPSILLTPIHLALPHNLSVGPSVISTPATAPVAPAVPALRRAPVAPAVPALRRAPVAPAAAASPPAPVTTSHDGKQFSTFLLFQVSCRHGILFDNFSVSDIYTDESSSGSSGAHDLEAEMEEIERFAVDTAVLSEAPTILDSSATDKNNNNYDFWTPTLTKEDVKEEEDAVVISDEEEEEKGNGCEWIISYEEAEEGNGCEWGSIFFFSV